MSEENDKSKKYQFDLFPLNTVFPSSWTEIARILGFVILAIILAAAAISALIGVLYLSNEIFEIATKSAEGESDKQDNFAKLRNSLFILAALIGVPFFLWRTWIARRQSLSAEHQAETARDRAYTELFTKAIEQLGAEKPKKEDVLDENGKPAKDEAGQTIMKEIYVPNIEVRIGAIFALERIMKDSEKDAASVVDTLAAYVRENCGKPTLVCEIPEEEDFESTHEWVSAIKDYVGDVWLREEGSLVARARALRDQPQANRADIKTALTVIGRRPDWLKDPEKFKSPTYEMPDLQNVNFQGWDLIGFDLSWCKLSGANMQGADMLGAQMQGAHMSGAKMQGANISDTQMRGADITYAKLQGANMSRAKIKGADMVFAQMQGAEMQGAEMSHAKMQWADMRVTELQEAKMSDANMQRADMAFAEMKGADMSHAKMQGAKMSYAKMQGAEMFNAKMQGANMSGAEMKGADMSHANMQGADMQGTELQGADMSFAQIEKVQITSAWKTAASVIWVDFKESKFEFHELQEQLPEMFGHKEATTLPDYMAIPEHWSEADMRTDEGRAQYEQEWEAFKKKMGVM